MTTRALSRTVLIADDDALVRIVLRAALERSGYRVVAAENGAAAIKMAQSGSPDVVILDARMPGLSLDEILARVQPTPETGPPVLVLSGQLGAPRGGLGPRVGTLTKPVELRALLAELDRLLELG